MTSYTKGEWIAIIQPYDAIEIKSAQDGKMICAIGFDTTVNPSYPQEQIANAQLIALSPRLFEYIKGKADEGDNDAKCFLAVLGLE